MPGFVWAQRWRAADDNGPGPRYLTLYGLAALEALQSPAYQRLLAGPTPWSQRMRPHLLRLSRWACVLEVGGNAVAGAAMQAVCLQDQPATTMQVQLLAQRQRDAVPLPWLAGKQALDVPGDWLVCADDVGPLPEEVYRRSFTRLPVGRDDSVGASRWPVASAH